MREFLINTQATQESQEELDQFMKNISPSLRFKVLVQIFSKTMNSSLVFQNLFATFGKDAVIPFVVRNLNIFLTIPESDIIKQDDLPEIDYAIQNENKLDNPEENETKIFFIVKGDCDVFVQFEDAHVPKFVRRLHTGDHFGEISMIYR